MLDKPWAITPTAYAQLSALHERASRGEAVTPIASRSAPPKGANARVAVVPITGFTMKSPGVFAKLFGACDTMAVGEQFAQAMNSPDVDAVMLYVDSPGGTVDGTQTQSDQIYAARGRKPMAAYIDGAGTSAAYLLASATGKVYAGDDTTAVGSIGVIATHYDQSAADAAEGVKVTHIVSTPLKSAGSAHRPLDEAGAAVMQERVDAIHKVFEGQVARNRGMTSSAASKVADARIYLGREAVAAGLIDGVKSFGAVLADLGAQAAARAPKIEAKAPPQDVAARARVYIIEQERLGRRVTAAEAVSYINSL